MVGQKFEAAIEAILALIESMTDDERSALFETIRSNYCEHCGREEPAGGPYCQCWNDE